MTTQRPTDSDILARSRDGMAQRAAGFPLNPAKPFRAWIQTRFYSGSFDFPTLAGAVAHVWHHVERCARYGAGVGQDGAFRKPAREDQAPGYGDIIESVFPLASFIQGAGEGGILTLAEAGIAHPGEGGIFAPWTLTSREESLRVSSIIAGAAASAERDARDGFPHGAEREARSAEAHARNMAKGAERDATASVALALRELATCAESILRDMPRDAARAIGSPLRERIAAARAILAQHGEDSSVPGEAARALALTAPLAAMPRAPELPRHAPAPARNKGAARPVWSSPAPSDTSRERAARVAGFDVRVWRVTGGMWAWGAYDVSRRDVVASYHVAPSVALAQRDAETWARANQFHAQRSWARADAPLLPPTVYALHMGEVSRFLRDPGESGFMVAPPESAIAEGRRIREARAERARNA